MRCMLSILGVLLLISLSACSTTRDFTYGQSNETAPNITNSSSYFDCVKYNVTKVERRASFVYLDTTLWNECKEPVFLYLFAATDQDGKVQNILLTSTYLSEMGCVPKGLYEGEKAKVTFRIYDSVKEINEFYISRWYLLKSNESRGCDNLYKDLYE